MRSAYWYPAGTDLDGEPLVLDDGTGRTMFIQWGASGMLAPEWTIVASPSPGVPGAQLRAITMGVRTIKLPLYLKANDRASLMHGVRGLVSAMNPTAPGRLLVTDMLGTPSGTQRYINAIYGGGLEGDESAMRIGNVSPWWQFTLELQCLDPLWYSRDQVKATWQGAGVASTFFVGTFPWTLAPYALTDAALPLDLAGDPGVPMWPSWTLSGPWTKHRVVNRRTGEWWEVSRAKAATDTIIVTTYPGRVSIRTSTGANAYGLRTTGSKFFSLLPGDSVLLESAGTSAASRVDLAVDEAWLSP